MLDDFLFKSSAGSANPGMPFIPPPPTGSGGGRTYNGGPLITAAPAQAAPTGGPRIMGYNGGAGAQTPGGGQRFFGPPAPPGSQSAPSPHTSAGSNAPSASSVFASLIGHAIGMRPLASSYSGFSSPATNPPLRNPYLHPLFTSPLLPPVPRAYPVPPTIQPRHPYSFYKPSSFDT